MAHLVHPVGKRSRGPARLGAFTALGLVLAGLTTGTPSAATATGTATGPCSPHSGVTCELGVPYVDGGTPLQTLDIYYPTDRTDLASVVIIHGGRWMQGDSRTFTPEALYFAQNGFAVFSVNYSLSQPGQPSWPQVLDDVETATAWVMAHADDHHGDSDRVGLLGGSSGGHLAALVDTAGPENGVAPLATVAWSGPMDLTITYDKGNRTAKYDLFQFLGCSPDECPQTYAAASPVTHVTSDDGSMLFFHSRNERVPVAGAFEMNRALAAAGVPHRLVIFKHSIKHAREYECDPARVEGETLPVIDDSMRWLGTQLGQPTTPTGTYCR